MVIKCVVDSFTDDMRIHEMIPEGVYLNMYRMYKRNQIKDAKKLLSEYGAVKLPFIIIEENNKLITHFYSELYSDPISECKKYLNENYTVNKSK